MSRAPLSAAVLAAALAGCGDLGGATARPSVSVRAAELDDEDVPTVSPGEAGSLGVAVPVLAPDGNVILPPDLRDRVGGQAPAEDAAAEESD